MNEPEIKIFFRECEKMTGLLLAVITTGAVIAAMLFAVKIFIPVFFLALNLIGVNSSSPIHMVIFFAVLIVTLYAAFTRFDRILCSLLACTYVYQAAIFSLVYKIGFKELFGFLFVNYPATFRTAYFFNQFYSGPAKLAE